MDISLADAEPLIKKKLVWVHRENRPIRLSREPKKLYFGNHEFVDGEGFYFLGRHYRLKLIDPEREADPIDTIRLMGEHLLFCRDQVASGAKRVEEFVYPCWPALFE